MMNVLIITGEFGNGHTAAAKALRQELLHEDPHCRVVIADLVRYLCPRCSRLVYGAFNRMAEHANWLYNAINHIGEKSRQLPMKGLFSEKFQELIDRHAPDLIISTWPIGARYIGAYKEYTGSRIPYITCITDVAPNYEWISSASDAYLVGDRMTRERLMRMGVDRKKIFVSGIPVRHDFLLDRAPFRCTEEDGGEEGCRRILIMGGGLGLMPGIDELLHIFAAWPDLRTTVITGRNEKLKQRLKKAWPRADIRGYVASPAACMRRADWLVTKAGGITTFEAIHAGTPMLILPPFLEQERDNAAFIERRKIGRILFADRNLWAEQIAALLRDPAAGAEIAAQMRSLRREFAAQRLSGVIEEVMRRRPAAMIAAPRQMPSIRQVSSFQQGSPVQQVSSFHQGSPVQQASSFQQASPFQQGSPVSSMPPTGEQEEYSL
ncbi:MAG: MGDG synthase family glycosyltransferase [Anaerovoracaceae bacterium]|jgi:processive 1,2-diacylglycerol beta-glucosyltransferase